MFPRPISQVSPPARIAYQIALPLAPERIRLVQQP